MSLVKWLPRFRRAYRELELLAARETWSRNQIETFQLERLNALWRHAAQYVPYYRALQRERQLPAVFSSVREFCELMPLLEKRVVQERRFELLSSGASRGSWRVTGGSTGTPTVVFRSKAAHLEMLRARYQFYATWNVDILDRMAFLWGHSASHAPGFFGWVSKRRIPVEDYFRNRLRLSAYEIDPATLRRYLDRIRAFRPAAIYGYATAGHLLATEAEAVGFRCDTLKLINLTAEPVSPAIVNACERAFRVPTVVEYGSVECGFLAGEAPDRTLRVREDLVLLEALPRADDRYDLVVTVLNNPSYPLLRYSIGDVTPAPLEKPERGFAILQSVAGRNNDALIGRSGRCYHAAAVMDFVDDFDCIRCYRIYQRMDGSVSLALEAPNPTARDLVLLERGLRELVEGYPIEIQLVSKVHQTPAGNTAMSFLNWLNRSCSAQA